MHHNRVPYLHYVAKPLEYFMGTTGDTPQSGNPPAFALHYTTRTVVFADVVESVRLVQRDELTAAQRIRALLLEAANEIVPANRGHLLQRLGDGLMLDFAHPRHAAECARALHRRCAELSANLSPDDRVLLRVGIHAADILTDDVAFYGHGVNVAARLAALAGPGETVISAAARDELTAGLDGEIEDLGTCHLKNIEAPLRAYRLGPRNAQPPALESQIKLRPTLAVIPLAFRGGGREFLAVGEIIADEVIAAMSQAPELRVVSRLSTTAFRGRKLELDDIRTYLGATYVLSGGYRVVGDALIVNVELADTRNNDVMWANGFRTKVSALLAQDNDLVGSLVAGASDAIMNTEIARATTRALPTLDAGTLLLAGIGLMHRSDPRDFDKGRRVFEHLIERYPRFSAPYAYLAEWHVFKVTQGWFVSLENEAASALDRVNRALDIDPADSLALTVNGMVHTNLLRKHDIAKQSYDLALQKNPNAGLAWLHRGTLWAFQGRGREAMEETERAAALSPLDPWRYYYDSLCATAALAARDYGRAIELARRSMQANRTHVSTLRVIAIAASELGRMDEARDTVTELRKLDPSLTVSGYLARSPARNFETSRIWAEALRRAALPA
jgi:adenylate cyclase